MTSTPKNDNSTRSRLIEALELLLVLLVAAIVRGIYLFNHPLETRDGILYIEFIRDWFARGDAAIPEFLQTQPPLYCYLSRILMYCNLSAEASSLSVNFAAGILLIIPIYFSGKLLFGGKKPGLQLALLAAVMPVLIKYSCIRLREGLYFFFLFVTFNFLLHTLWGKRESICAFLCGLFATTALLARYEALEMLLFCGGGIFLCGFFPQVRWKKILLLTGIFLLGVLAGIAVIKLLPGLPDITIIFINRIKAQWLGTSLNPIK